MVPQGTDFLRERPWFAKPLGQRGHLSLRHMLHSLGVCSSFISVGVVSTLTEITLGLKGGLLQLTVPGHSLSEQGSQGGRDWRQLATPRVQSRAERHE